MKRDELIGKITCHLQKEYDVIIIGGGATGLGTALDAISRGYDTLLLEKNDFSASTSSKSTKLIHGGVRYLAQGDIFLVREALKERSIILNNAPNITFNQKFVIPVYTIFDLLLYTIGLKFYDLLAGRRSLGRSRLLSPKDCAKALPLIKTKGLKGGVEYHDGQFNDSRMSMFLVHKCLELGATVINYFGVDSLLKSSDGEVTGVIAKDELTGNRYKLGAKLTVNATGVFANDIMKMYKTDSKPILRPSQGTHIVIDKKFLGGNTALMIPKTDDGRVLFAIPWYDKVVVGTTDRPIDVISLEPKATEEELTFILRNLGKYSSYTPVRNDILSVFTGLRPLAHNPNKPKSTKEISRRHKIFFTGKRLVTIVGGKWTTFRLMAEELLDTAANKGLLPYKRSVSKNMEIGKKISNLRHQHLNDYGPGAIEIEEMISQQPELGAHLSSHLPYTKAEIIWICDNEFPVKLEDVLARRTRSLLLDAKAAIDIAPEVASVMANAYGFDQQWIKNQLLEFESFANAYL
jgi:glycerol-3-phosphate dehydrogenase